MLSMVCKLFDGKIYVFYIFKLLKGDIYAFYCSKVQIYSVAVF